ncbi:flagellar biosynthetic protein FliQ [Henriciella sp.]|uniref:flagellar biosynthetic protein FliQ n=1 Tax=Henriciella sp. TaxID=1968823 RepID=UPI0026123FAD|nr:flagellar biosynthetic protein FliQ [Henriciella sp.]
MTELAIFEVLRSALWAAVMMSMPILSVTLVLGLMVGLFQALTSIQELTLTFVPKIFAVVVVLFLTLGYMTRIALDLFNNSILPLVAA